ncbi:MAG: stalk domain-containing protein [Bacillota bacterium]
MTGYLKFKGNALFAAVVLFFWLFSGGTAMGEEKTAVETTYPSIYTGEKRHELIWEPGSGGLDYLVAAPDMVGPLGASYYFYPSSGCLVIKKGPVTVDLYMDSTRAVINGFESSVPQPPRMVEGVIYLPLNTIAEKMGYEVGYDQAANIFHLAPKTAVPLSEGGASGENPSDVLPSGAVFLDAPAQLSDNGVAVTTSVSGDFNGDGKDETAAIYRSKDEKYGIVVYRAGSSGYKRIWHTEKDFMPSIIRTAEVNGSCVLVTGWDTGLYTGANIEIYSFGKDIPVLLFSKLSNRFETGDFDGDGSTELAVWQTEKDLAQSVSVYKWNGDGFVRSDYCPGYYAGVISYFNDLKNKTADKKPVLYSLAEAYLRNREYNPALGTASEGTATAGNYPDYSRFDGIKGIALTGMGKYREALPYLERALKGIPGPVWPEARFALSQCYLNTGKVERGKFELARSLNEGSDWAGFNSAAAVMKSLKDNED